MLIQIAVEIGNPKIVCISDFFIFINTRHTKRQSSGTFAGFSFYLIYIEWRICHDVIAASVQIVSIMVEGVCSLLEAVDSADRRGGL